MRLSRFSTVFVLILLGAAAPAPAAELEVTPTVAYRSDDYSCTGSGVFILSPEPAIFPPPTCAFVRAESDDGPAVGAVIGIGAGHGLQIEVLASRQETELELRFLPAVEEVLAEFEIFFPLAKPDFTVTHLQVGVARTWGAGTLRPFVGVAAGVSRVEADDALLIVDFQEDAPSASLGAGGKVFFDDRIGLRLEGRGYWVDLPSEAGGDFTQIEAALGLVLRF